MEGPARFQYDLDEDGRIRMNPDGTITVAWWLREESGEWRLDGEHVQEDDHLMPRGVSR